MPTAIYIITFSLDAWWIDLEGHSQGPYAILETAMTVGVSAAAAIYRDGRRSEVQVFDPPAKARIIYQSPERSLLSRAAAVQANESRQLADKVRARAGV